MSEKEVLQIVKGYMLKLSPDARSAFDKRLLEVIKTYEGIPF